MPKNHSDVVLLIIVGLFLLFWWLYCRLPNRKSKPKQENELEEDQMFELDGSLTKDQVRHIRNKGTCPDCGGGLLEGPCGGMCMNVKCEKCSNKFNIVLAFGGGGIIGAQRIDS